MGLDNPIHIAFLLILLLLVFGAKRLPEMGHSLGSGMRGFKDALSGQSASEAASAQSASPALGAQQQDAVTRLPATGAAGTRTPPVDAAGEPPTAA